MRVAVAIITDDQQRLLITQRASHVPHGGLWEFPGGKLENDELAPSALIREIKEEVGLDVLAYHFLGEVSYNYQQQAISLLVYHVSRYQGEAICREAQMDLRWVAIENLDKFQFPAANVEIITLVKSHLSKEKVREFF